ncbi:hypothetical protein T479_11810 [Lysinibacillus varians]|nr:hypothetical protein T479_11810 [Lysinibacillus varians]
MTKQNNLFVTVRQTTNTKGYKGIRHQAKSLPLVHCLMLSDE